jgi:hypothetical protein
LKEKVLKLGSKSFFFLKTSLNETAVPGGAKKTNFRKDRYFRKSFKVLLQQSFFCRCTEPWHLCLSGQTLCGLVLKLTHGADEQVDSIHSCLAQSWHNEFYTKSSQVSTLPKAKSQAKDKRAKDRQ